MKSPIKPKMEPIAVVGIGGLFPASPDLASFWANIVGKVDTSGEIPPERWPRPPREFYDPEIARADHVYSTRACLLPEIEFDPAGLHLAAKELEGLDPMFALALRVGVEAFEDGSGGEMDLDRVGVTLANIVLPTDATSELTRKILGSAIREKISGKDGLSAESSPQSNLGNPLNRYAAGLPAALLAKGLRLGGGAMTLDAACASSLYAIKLACDELNAGRVDAMLAGGINRPQNMYTQMGFSQLRALSAEGKSRPFDHRADGLVVGEGGGVFLLKRLHDAVEAEDRIYAVIRGIGLSNDRGGSLLAPASEGQLRSMRAAYDRAGWTPSMVDLVECHATGTPLGDRIEAESLKQLWAGGNWSPGQCAIGSVKSNFGHLLTAAGAASLMKVIFAMREATLPPSNNFEELPEGINLEGSPFRVPTEPAPWQRREPSVPRRAAVSAFGFGGINAHLLVEEWDEDIFAEVDSASVAMDGSAERAKSPIAIVGMDVHAGPLDSLRKFQEAALGGKSVLGPINESRWFGIEASEEGLGNGATIDSFSFPLDRFRIPPKEIEQMLPQQLLMLLVAHRALQDAGADAADPDRGGVFLGIGLDLNTTNFYARWCLPSDAREWTGASESERADRWLKHLQDSSCPSLSPERVLGALGGMVASRVARELRIGGPSFTISSEENSGTAALEVAVRALQNGELDYAIAGAVDLAGDLRAMLCADQVAPYTRGPGVSPFDALSDGTAVGEGAVAMVLKRLEDAERDGDRIYAVVRGAGSASATERKQIGPCAEAYSRALSAAYEDAQVDPASIELLEAHASGNPEEDWAEAEAIRDFFSEQSDDTDEAKEAGPRRPCALGSVKAQVGHTGAAAGLVSLAKAALCLYQEILPAFPGLDDPLDELKTPESRFHTPRTSQYWYRNRAEGPRRAGVSSMSLDGGCRHVVLEAYEGSYSDATREQVAAERAHPLGALPESLFAVTGKSRKDLTRRLEELLLVAQSEGTDSLPEIARAWWETHGDGRGDKLGLAIVSGSKEELFEQMEVAGKFLRGRSKRRIDLALPVRDRIFFSPDPVGPESPVAFVYPGSGNHYLSMGAESAAHWPEVPRRLDGENELLRRQFAPELFAPWRLEWPEGWEEDAREKLVGKHGSLIFGHVSHGTLVTDLVRTFEVHPQSVIGYSLGETAGYFATRAWTARDEMVGRVEESKLFASELVGDCTIVRMVWELEESEPVDWSVGLVDRTAQDVKDALREIDRAYLLIINTPNQCVIGGQGNAVQQAVQALGCNFIPLEGISTVHCEVTLPVRDSYRGLHLFKTTPLPGVRYYGSAFGRAYDVSRQGAADSMVAQAIGPIDFPRLISQAYEDGARVFLEMGPQNSCTRMITDILGDRPYVARSASLQGQSDVSCVLRVLGRLVSERIPVDLSRLYAHAGTSESEKPTRNSITIELGERLGPYHAIDEFDEHFSDKEDGLGRGHYPEQAEQMDLLEILEASSPEPMLPMQFHDEAASAAPATASPWTEARTDAAAVQARGPQYQEFVDALGEMRRASAEAHERFLRYSQTATEIQSRALTLQMSLLQSLENSGASVESYSAPPTEPPAIFSRELCLEFARGKLGNVLGEAFAEIDTYPTRVRLPDEPLMLVDRITSVTGEPGSMKPGTLVTEHDVRPGAWYLDGGRMVPGVTIESGQADLFLCAYLGIDFETKGLSQYRLLDAAVTYHRELPAPGEVIRFDIHIDRFARHGDTHLFFFHYDGTVGGELLMSMRGGCAGFFTEQQLEEGRGLVLSEAELNPPPGKLSADWTAPVTLEAESYDDSQIQALRTGDLAACFGEGFKSATIAKPYTLPGGHLALIDRVVSLEPEGGRFGIGSIRAEKDIDPNAWFLTCHFVDDPVMPGTLMHDSCLQALRVFLLRLGWVGEEGTVRYEPVPGVEAMLRCRGQVLPTTGKATYEISIKELGFGPEPFAIADAIMYSDGRAIVYVSNISIQAAGLTREILDEIWRGKKQPRAATAEISGSLGAESVLASEREALRMPHGFGPKPPVFDRAMVEAYAIGKPSEAFGDRYRVFDEERFLARLPGPPFLFVDRITETGGVPFQMKAGALAEAQWDVPPDAWFFAANRAEHLPYSVILEFALQPCGFLAAYMGSALTSTDALHFRNLGGTAVLHEIPGRDAGTLTAKVQCLSVARSAGMIIQNYSLLVHRQGKVVFEGETSFGFFSAHALSQQVGVRGASRYELDAEEAARSIDVALPLIPPLDPEDPDSAFGENLALPAGAYLMAEEVEIFVPDGGPAGLGFIRGAKNVNPEEWFFKAHFKGDPVWPGSLGLEAFLQLLKVVAIHRWGDTLGSAYQFEPIAVGVPHTWAYRGQVIRTNQRVEIEASITEIDDGQKLIKAEGFLIVDGKIIYQMTEFGLRIVADE